MFAITDTGTQEFEPGGAFVGRVYAQVTCTVARGPLPPLAVLLGEGVCVWVAGGCALEGGRGV